MEKKRILIKSILVGALETFCFLLFLLLWTLAATGSTTPEENKELAINLFFMWIYGTFITTLVNNFFYTIRSRQANQVNTNGVNTEQDLINYLKSSVKKLVEGKILEGEQVTFQPVNQLSISHDINKNIYEVRSYVVVEKNGELTKKEFYAVFNGNSKEFVKFVFNGEEVEEIFIEKYGDAIFIEELKIGVYKSVMRRITKREKVVAFQQENELLINHDVSRNIYEVKGYVLVEKKGVTTRKDYYIVFDRAKDKYTIFVFNGENIKLKTD